MYDQRFNAHDNAVAAQLGGLFGPSGLMGRYMDYAMYADRVITMGREPRDYWTWVES